MFSFFPIATLRRLFNPSLFFRCSLLFLHAVNMLLIFVSKSENTNKISILQNQGRKNSKFTANNSIRGKNALFHNRLHEQKKPFLVSLETTKSLWAAHLSMELEIVSKPL